MKRIISLVLAVVLALTIAPFAIASNRTISDGEKLLSASDEWTMGSGWMDLSTPDEIIFQNTKDTAGANFNRTLIDGTKGFRIGFDVEFMDPTLQSTAIIDLRVNSQTDRHFRLLVTGRGDEAMFQVDYCNGGSWINVVPFTAGMMGTNGKYHVSVEREASSNAVTFRLTTMDGKELFKQTATDKAWSGAKFLNSTDLEFIVTPIAGYGLFKISGYNVQDYPDDGIEDGTEVVNPWAPSANWKSEMVDGQSHISNLIQNAGPIFHNELIKQGESFRISFLYTGLSEYTTADVTLRLMANHGVYIRMLVTKNAQGQAIVDVNYHNGSWHQLGSTGWIPDVGDSYRVTLEHIAGTDTMRLILTKPDGAMITAINMSGNPCTHDAFFNISDIQALVTTVGDYGLFAIDGFTLYGDAVEAANWTMGPNWTGYYDDNGEYVVQNVIQNAGPNFYGNHIGQGKSFRLSFLYTGISDYTTGDIVMRLNANHGVYLQARTTQNNGTALIDLDFHNGSWHRLTTTGWIPDVGKSYYVHIDHMTGTDTVTLTIEKLDGTIAYCQEVSTPALTDAGFFQVSDIEPLVNTVGDYGIFSIGGLKILEPIAAADQWEMGNGWTDAGGYENSAVTNTTDTGAAPLFWKESIDASAGVIIDFDFEAKVEAMQTTAELVLRRTDNHAKYMRMVITARGPREYIVETSYFDGAGWTALDSTGWLADDATSGKYNVHIAHQANSSSTTLILTAENGKGLYRKTFESAVLTDKEFWSASDLQLLFNPIPGYGCFTISNMQVREFPAEPVDSDLWEMNSGWAVYPDGDDTYLAKTDKAQTEAHYTQHINGKDGFKVKFDVSFDSLSTSVCYWKLRTATSPELYLFGRVKGDHNQTMLEAQSYIAESDTWSTSLLSAKANSWTANSGGMVTVIVARQAFSNEMHYIAIDKDTGVELFHEVFTSPVLTADKYLDCEELIWTFGTDEGSPTFKIRNFTVETWPGEASPAETVTVIGQEHAFVGDSLSFTATIAPENANIKSYEWLVDGIIVGSGKTLAWKFVQAGTVQVSLKVTDYSGNTVIGTLNVEVEPVYEMGDVDLNGVVDQADAQLLCDYVAGCAQLTEKQLGLADLNGDGVCNSVDAWLILAQGGK